MSNINKISLKSALESALISSLDEDGPMNAAIVYENGEFSFESALHGAHVVIDLQSGCGAFEIESESDSASVARQWLEWCMDDVQDQIDEIEEDGE